MRNGSMVRVVAGLRLVLALALTLLGFAFTHVFVSGSRAAEVTTTIPKPDPPPTTSAHRTAPPPAPPPPRPQPQPAVPPPPSPPAPPPPPAPPAAAPAAATGRAATAIISGTVAPTGASAARTANAGCDHCPRTCPCATCRQRTARPLPKRVRASVHFTPPRPSSPQRDAMAVSAVIPPADSSQSSAPMLVMLAVAIGFSLG